MEKLEKIAIVTYNRIGDGRYDNGVIKSGNKEIYISQNGHCAKWAIEPYTSERPNEIRARAAKTVLQQVNLEDMDYIYLYIGAGGGEETIKETRNIPAEKLTYVMCDCNYSHKRRRIKECGNEKADIQWCECGGRETLEKILKQVLTQ